MRVQAGVVALDSGTFVDLALQFCRTSDQCVVCHTQGSTPEKQADRLCCTNAYQGEKAAKEPCAPPERRQNGESSGCGSRVFIQIQVSGLDLEYVIANVKVHQQAAGTALER